MRLTILAIAAAIAATLLAAPLAEAGKRKVPRGFFGVNYAGNIENAPGEQQKDAWDRLARAGVESARVVFNWDIANKVKGAPIDWYRTDNAVRFASQRRISVLPTVLYAPRWAKRYPNWVSSPPKDPSDYTRFLKKLIGRYGPKGSFWTQNKDVPKRPIRVWQIWNEVELQFQWYRPENRWKPKHAAQYGNLLRASYKAVHDEDPGAKVMLSALAIDSWYNLADLYDHGGIRGHFDIAALQPQAGKPSFLPTLLRRFRKVLNDNGDKKVPIWGTELAQPASEGRSPPLGYATGYMDNYATTDAGMASHLKRSYELLAKRSFRREVRLKRVFWFTAVSPYSGDFEYDYSGLLWQRGGTLQPKPAFGAYTKAAQKLEGCTKTSRGECK